jgi:MFS family permease
MLTSSKYHPTSRLPVLRRSWGIRAFSYWYVCYYSRAHPLHPLILYIPGGGTISDLFTSDERGRASSIYTMAPLTGPAIGPIIGGFIAQNTTWRWVFYSSSIADGVIQILGLVRPSFHHLLPPLIKHTYPRFSYEKPMAQHSSPKKPNVSAKKLQIRNYTRYINEQINIQL